MVDAASNSAKQECQLSTSSDPPSAVSFMVLAPSACPTGPAGPASGTGGI